MRYFCVAVTVLIACLAVVPVNEIRADYLSNRHTLRVCTQNLNNFMRPRRRKGSSKNRKTIRKKEKRYQLRQRGYLVERFLQAKCDVVAVQEVYGKSRKHAQKNLEFLASAFSSAKHRRFSVYVGNTHDDYIRNGFLIDTDVVRVKEVRSFVDYPLPVLSRTGSHASFARGPLLLVIETLGHAGKLRGILLLTLHFKSKVGAWKDYTHTKFELLRMEMAEGLREIALDLLSRPVYSGYSLLMLGDLNSGRDSATARILSGSLRLSDFRRNCRLNVKQKVLCKKLVQRDPIFQRLFNNEIVRHGKLAHNASYRYKDREELIDEILLSSKDVSLLRYSDEYSDQPKVLNKVHSGIGMQGVFNRGSDHKLLWVDLVW